MVRREGLDQAGLQVGAGAVDDDVRGLQVPAAHDHVHGAILAPVLTGWRGALGRGGELGENPLLLLDRQRLELLHVVALTGDHPRHHGRVEDAAERADVGDLRVVLEPHGVREAAPGELLNAS